MTSRPVLLIIRSGRKDRTIRIELLTAARRQEWNEAVAASPSFALLQTWEWGEFKEGMGWTACRVAVEDRGNIVAGAQLLIKTGPWGWGSVAYVPRGPFGDWLGEDIRRPLLDRLRMLARLHKSVFLKIEPPLTENPSSRRLFLEHGFRPGRYTNQPRATAILDLKGGLEEIQSRMAQKTRQYIRRAARSGLQVRPGDSKDLPAFYGLLKTSFRRHHSRPRIREYYDRQWHVFAPRGQAMLLLAYGRGELLAGRMIFRCGPHAAEFHAGASGRHPGLRPNHLLVWEAIKWAKAEGCSTYDLWGIPDEAGRALQKGVCPPRDGGRSGLWGLFKFKRGFGGKEAYYLGAYDYIFSRVPYRILFNPLLRGGAIDAMASKLDLIKRSRPESSSLEAGII